MNAGSILTALLLTVMVLVQLGCAVGVLLGRGTLDRLHFIAPASTVGMLVLALAVFVGGQGAIPRIKTTLIAVVVALTGAVVTHATGRAAVIRREHGLPSPDVWEDDA